MVELYDFQTGLRVDAQIKKFDHFHDWVIWEVRLIPSSDEMVSEEDTQLQYDAEVVLHDPYKRFEKSKALLRFSNVNALSVRGLSVLGSELQGISVVKTPTGVKAMTDDEDFFYVEADNLKLSLF